MHSLTVILIRNAERELAYQRWNEAMQKRAELEAQKTLSQMKRIGKEK